MNTCRKLSFRTIESAERTVQIISGIRGGFRKPKRIYHCPKCDQFHLSGKDEPEVRTPSTVQVIEQSTPALVVPPVGSSKPEKNTGARVGLPASQPPRRAQEGGLPTKLKKKTLAHIEKVLGAAALKAEREHAKAEWFREKIRAASTAINRGDPLRADSILRACLSLPKKLSPGTDPKACELWMDEMIRAHEFWAGQRSASK